MVSKLFLALNLLITSTLYGCVPGAAFQIPISAIEKEDLAAVDLPECVSLESITNWLVFSATMSQFQQKKRERWLKDDLIWDDDGCTHAPDEPFGFNFTPACQRHDFGYRNFGKQSRCTETNRHKIDEKFLEDLENICPRRHHDGHHTCNWLAGLYYHAVDSAGEGHCENGNIPCGKPGTPWCRHDSQEESWCKRNLRGL